MGAFCLKRDKFAIVPDDQDHALVPHDLYLLPFRELLRTTDVDAFHSEKLVYVVNKPCP